MQYECAAKCGKFGNDLKKCSRCRVVHYCSSKCQKDDWVGEHKVKCGEMLKSPQHEKARKLRKRLIHLLSTIPLLELMVAKEIEVGHVYEVKSIGTQYLIKGYDGEGEIPTDRYRFVLIEGGSMAFCSTSLREIVENAPNHSAY